MNDDAQDRYIGKLLECRFEDTFRASLSAASALDKKALLTWRDEDGRGVLHVMAMRGWLVTAEDFLKAGAAPDVKDAQGYLPEDLARIFGYTDVADMLAEKTAVRLAALPLPPSLAAARKTPDGLMPYARADRLSDIAARAAAAGESFSADDFLASPEKDGLEKSVLWVLCRRGRLGDILNAAAWARASGEFTRLWDHVPLDIRAGFDIKAFQAELRQEKIKLQQPASSRRNFRLK